MIDIAYPDPWDGVNLYSHLTMPDRRANDTRDPGTAGRRHDTLRGVPRVKPGGTRPAPALGRRA